MEVEWQRNLAWTSSRISSIAKRLGLGRTKVYKWTWDRKKKESLEGDAPGAASASIAAFTSAPVESVVVTLQSQSSSMMQSVRPVAPTTTTLANRFRQEMARHESQNKK